MMNIDGIHFWFFREHREAITISCKAKELRQKIVENFKKINELYDGMAP